MTAPQIAGFEPHDASNLFPLMDEAELSELAEDIREHGLLEPIVLCKGRVLDGRNRLLACQRAGVAPETVEWSGGESPTSWVLSMNLKRRHLTTSQRAMIAARARRLFEAEARERQIAALRQGSADPPVAANLQQREGRLTELQRCGQASPTSAGWPTSVGQG